MSLFTIHHGFSGHNEEGRESCPICLRASVSDLHSRLAAAEQERDNACENARTFEAALRKSEAANAKLREALEKISAWLFQQDFTDGRTRHVLEIARAALRGEK